MIVLLFLYCLLGFLWYDKARPKFGILVSKVNSRDSSHMPIPHSTLVSKHSGIRSRTISHKTLYFV